jgi:hypothetical protein
MRILEAGFQQGRFPPDSLRSNSENGKIKLTLTLEANCLSLRLFGLTHFNFDGR